MDPNSLVPSSLKEIQNSNKKRGRWTTVKDQVQTNFMVIISIIASLVISLYSQHNGFRTLHAMIESENNNLNINDNPNTNTNVVGDNNKVDLIGNDGKVEGDNTLNFNPDDWIIESFDQDEEGYYCPRTRKFEFWSMWSVKKIPPDSGEIEIKVRVKPRNNSDKPPTFAISYGEYRSGFSPVQYYRLNIFDTDDKSIRLYDDKNDSVAQDYLKDSPDITSDLLITLSPRIPDPKSRKVILNPSILYAISGQEAPGVFSPESEFSTLLPTVLPDNQASQQLGMGVNFDVCFKPITIEF